jgi:hypothetical protein
MIIYIMIYLGFPHQNPDMDCSVRPELISCIGEIANAIGSHFEEFLPVVMEMLLRAAQTHASGKVCAHEYLFFQSTILMPLIAKTLFKCMNRAYDSQD